MLEAPKFVGLIDLNQNLSQNFYHKLGEGSNMSTESFGSLQMSTGGGSVAMSVDNSSVGSNCSGTRILNHGQGLNRVHNNYSAAGSVNRGRVTNGLSNDALAQALIDPRFPTIGLENYAEWTIDLGKLTMGQAFAQGAFGKLYKGTYNGEDVAIKLLEKPEHDLERAHLMEQQFQQEVMMLANLKHPNIVRFIGACRKPMVWCIVTEYARGGSVRQFLNRRHNRAVPLKLAVKQALDVARGMEYVHALNLIHRDLKSDNLLIAADKSIKIADFGVARIEVQTEGMTPETGTYRWMAPFCPNTDATPVVTKCMKSQWKESWPSWGAVPPQVKQRIMQSFEVQCKWHPALDYKVRSNFPKKCGELLKNAMYNARKKRKMPGFLYDHQWRELQQYWDSPEFQKKSEQGKKVRASSEGGSLHTGGSVSAATQKMRLEKQENRTIPLSEMHKIRHIKKDKKGGEAWVEPRAQETWERATKAVEDWTATQQSECGSSTPAPLTLEQETNLWLEAVGGVKKGSAYGLATLYSSGKHKSNYLGSCSTAPSSYVTPEKMTRMEQEIEELKSQNEAMRLAQEAHQREMHEMMQELLRNQKKGKGKRDSSGKGKSKSRRRHHSPSESDAGSSSASSQ